MKDIIQLQRATVAEHIRAENAKGVPASGNPVRIEIAAFFLFGAGADADKLVAERIYFDNGMALRQMRGEKDAPTGIGLAESVP